MRNNSVLVVNIAINAMHSCMQQTNDSKRLSKLPFSSKRKNVFKTTFKLRTPFTLRNGCETNVSKVASNGNLPL